MKLDFLSVYTHKVELSIGAGIIGASIAAWFTDFINSNINWIIVVVLFVFIDTLLGIWKGFINNKVSSKRYEKFLKKVIIYAVIVFVAHGMRYASGGEGTSDAAKTFLNWIKEALLFAVLVRETISILEKAGAIWPGSVPKWLLKRLEDFDENGNFIAEPAKETSTPTQQ